MFRLDRDQFVVPAAQGVGLAHRFDGAFVRPGSSAAPALPSFSCC